jgi:hypothetical protein
LLVYKKLDTTNSLIVGHGIKQGIHLFRFILKDGDPTQTDSFDDSSRPALSILALYLTGMDEVSGLLYGTFGSYTD